VARTVNPEEHAAKRAEILNTAMMLVLTKGWERVTIRAILKGAGISKGAFYHYFDSKSDLLDAYIEQIRDITHARLLPLIEREDLSALEKLQGYFDTFKGLRTDNIEQIVALGKIWYADVNAVVHQRVAHAVRRQRAPLLARILELGVEEGRFTVAHPDVAGHILYTLVEVMEAQHADLLWRASEPIDEDECADTLARVHDFTMWSIERVIGAPEGSLTRVGVDEMHAILRAIQEVDA